MNEVFAISLRGMQADTARLDQIGMNLANVLTPAYQRGVTVQAAQNASFSAHLSEAAMVSHSSAAAPPLTQMTSAARGGTFRSTGHGLDVALAGKGYFEVTTSTGPAYTRDGSFRLDQRGRLVTAHGHPVMGVDGEIVLGVATPVIAASGAISDASGEARALGHLKVVEFGDSKLRPLGAGLHAAGSEMKLVAEEQIEVRQGFLENSNVSSAAEVTSLIQTMRHFESMQKMAQGYDDMLGAAIRKLGDVS